MCDRNKPKYELTNAMIEFGSSFMNFSAQYIYIFCKIQTYRHTFDRQKYYIHRHKNIIEIQDISKFNFKKKSQNIYTYRLYTEKNNKKKVVF